ncbi:unnamed protein product, partial [Owenia fusiformis]
GMSLKHLFLLRPQIVPQTSVKHTASVIFLHGSGDSGFGVRQWVSDLIDDELTFPHIRMIYPTAPERPYTPMGGQISTVWFNRRRIAINDSEDLESTDYMCEKINELIDAVVSNGTPEERILLGGFSMGGAMALHVAYRHKRKLAGVFALSAFLNKDSAVYKSLQGQSGPLPPLFQCHGGKDPLVLEPWGEDTSKTLQSLGVQTIYRTFPNLYHQMNTREIMQLKEWIFTRLPNLDAASNS